VPVTAAVMVLMSVLAWTRPGVVNWGLTTTLPAGAHFAMLTLLMTAIGVGWGISWVTWASDYSRFVPRSVPSSSVFWYSHAGMFEHSPGGRAQKSPIARGAVAGLANDTAHPSKSFRRHVHAIFWQRPLPE
jgi:hypothetical protein